MDPVSIALMVLAGLFAALLIYAAWTEHPPPPDDSPGPPVDLGNRHD